MDIKIASLLVGFLILDLAQPGAQTASDDFSCRLCRPGYFASRPCSQHHDTICSPCPQGTFTPVKNTFRKCSPCSTCKSGYFPSQDCASDKDLECQACSDVPTVVSQNFLKECHQQDDPGPLDAEMADDKQDETGGQAADKDTAKEMLYEGSGVTIAEEESQDGSLDTGAGNLGGTSSEDTSEDESSGEGEMIWVPPSSDSDGDNDTATAVPSVTLPDDSAAEEFLPVSTKRTPVDTVITATNTSTVDTKEEDLLENKTTSTSKPGDVVVIDKGDEGLQLNDTASGPDDDDTVHVRLQLGKDSPSTSSPQKPTPTTTEAGIIIDQDTPVKIEDQGDDVYDVDVHLPPEPTKNSQGQDGTTRRKDFKTDKDGPLINSYDYSNDGSRVRFGGAEDEPQTGASQKQDLRDNSTGVSVGVVVAVAIAASVVFFILGFLASRYWRRRQRTFNVLEAEKTNGTAQQTIEYRDPEKSEGAGNRGVYDEIPADKKSNGTESEKKQKPARTSIAGLGKDKPEGAAAPTEDPVYSKPVKRNSSVTAPEKRKSSVTAPAKRNSSVTAPAKDGETERHEEPTPRGEKPERVSQIKFMDEVSDDEGETSKLLSKPVDEPTSGEASTSAAASKSAENPPSPRLGDITPDNENKTPVPSANTVPETPAEAKPMVSEDDSAKKPEDTPEDDVTEQTPMISAETGNDDKR